MESNTLFLRLEGHLQAWGSHESKLAIRRTQGFPSKSAIAGKLFPEMASHYCYDENGSKNRSAGH